MPSPLNVTSIKCSDTFSLTSGNTQLVDSIESINQSIRLILTTAPGELWGDPDFGSHLYEYLYNYSDNLLANLIKREIVRAVSLWEPRVVIQESDISVVYEGTDAHITIDYGVKDTNYRNSYLYTVKVLNEEDVYE